MYQLFLFVLIMLLISYIISYIIVFFISEKYNSPGFMDSKDNAIFSLFGALLPFGIIYVILYFIFGD